MRNESSPAESNSGLCIAEQHGDDGSGRVSVGRLLYRLEDAARQAVKIGNGSDAGNTGTCCRLAPHAVADRTLGTGRDGLPAGRSPLGRRRQAGRESRGDEPPGTGLKVHRSARRALQAGPVATVAGEFLIR